MSVQLILGGNLTELSAIFNYMLVAVYTRYSVLTTNIGYWWHQFRLFADQLSSFGSQFNNLVVIFNGLFVVTCRQGGHGCVNLSIWDHHSFAQKERLHCLKSQVCVSPNWMACVWGTWQGNKHDATVFHGTDRLDVLAEVY